MLTHARWSGLLWRARKAPGAAWSRRQAAPGAWL